jgi:RNA polymerase sigma-70 factor (sigma-E family)
VREPAGFRGFVESRYGALVRFGTLLTADRGRGEDLVQDSLVKTVRAWDRLYPDGDAEAYTRRVMTHASWRASRRLWRGERPTGELPERAAPDAYGTVDTADAVRRALASLPAQQRVVLVMRYWAHLSETEIAAELGVSAGTVKSRASRALAALRTSGLLSDTVGGDAS